MTGSSPRDEGMTLIELLISVSILGLIVGPITMVLFFGFSATRSAAQRTTDSSGAQLLTGYFASDVQSAVTAWRPGQTPLATPCGSGATRLELQSVDAATGVSIAVTYDAVPSASSGEPALRRQVWTVGSPCTAGDAEFLVRNLDPTALPVVVCVPTDCSGATTVQMTLTARALDVHNSNLYAPYAFTVAATKRGS